VERRTNLMEQIIYTQNGPDDMDAELVVMKDDEYEMDTITEKKDEDNIPY
jgi:hypothetical protein